MKLDIPEHFHLLRHVNMNKSIKPIPIIEKKNLILELETNQNYMRHQNMGCVLCRTVNKSFKEIVVPQWSGFYKLLSDIDTNITTYGYLPLFNILCQK